MKELTSLEELEMCIENSREDAIFLFKHSTSCPISSAARGRVLDFERQPGNSCPAIYCVKVIECRSVSDAIADRLGIQHQSPQLILVRDGNALWVASHYGIHEEKIRRGMGMLDRGE